MAYKDNNNKNQISFASEHPRATGAGDRNAGFRKKKNQ